MTWSMVLVHLDPGLHRVAIEVTRGNHGSSGMAIDDVIITSCVKQKGIYSTNHVYLHRPNEFGFWQMRLHLCYETFKRISNFSELA